MPPISCHKHNGIYNLPFNHLGQLWTFEKYRAPTQVTAVTSITFCQFQSLPNPHSANFPSTALSSLQFKELWLTVSSSNAIQKSKWTTPGNTYCPLFSYLSKNTWIQWAWTLICKFILGLADLHIFFKILTHSGNIPHNGYYVNLLVIS